MKQHRHNVLSVILGYALLVLLPVSALPADTKQLEPVNVLGVEPDSIYFDHTSSRIIHRQDIDNSTALNLTDLLRTEANLNIRSLFGDDRLSIIDIRGMGDTAVSNVLVVVDGVRINSNDLSSPDLSSIPVDLIESVEIIRGGGAVRYGNGAVGGVINIRTRQRQSEQAAAKIETTVGSFDLWQQVLSAGGRQGRIEADINARIRQTDGYRDNADLDTEDLALKLAFTPNEHSLWYITSQYHRDDARSPGNLARDQFLQSRSSRRSSSTPLDRNSSREVRVLTGGRFETKSLGEFTINASYRDRETDPNILNFSPLLSPAQQNLLLRGSYYDLSLKHSHDLVVTNKKIATIMGLDIRRSDFLRAQGLERNIDNDQRINAKLFEVAGFAELDIALHEDLKLRLGYRQNTLSTKQRSTSYRLINCTSIPVPPFLVNCDEGYRLDNQRSDAWDNHSVELSLGYSLNPNTFFYGNFTRNFRTPNIEELVLASDTLQPQTANNIDLGIRHTMGNTEMSMSLFRSRTKDEIFFGFDLTTLQNVNFNLPATTHREGFEFDVRWPATDKLQFNSNLGYVSAVNRGNDIPHVPRWNANLSADLSLSSSLSVLWNTEWVGARFDGNDVENVLPRLRPYSVTDIRMKWQQGHYRAFVGVNNLFNEVYSTLAFSQTFYPQPTRNLYAGVAYVF